MDYVKEIAELRKKINRNKSETDVAKIELCHREVRNELALKREQVIHLKKDLQEANSKIFKMTRELETNKSLLKESEFNLKLSLRKSAAFEEKMKDINESYTNLKLKEEMRMSEIQILNDNIQKMTQENHTLSREVAEFTDKFRYSRAFQDELENRQSKINKLIAKSKESVEKLQKEHVKVMEIETKLQNTEEFQNINELLLQENERLTKEYIKMEDKLIENTAKYEKLACLIERPRDADIYGANILGKIKYLQWENQCKNLQQKNINNEEIISTLTVTLGEEIETNAQLLQRNELYEARIEELENKIENNLTIKQENSRDSVIELE